MPDSLSQYISRIEKECRDREAAVNDFVAVIRARQNMIDQIVSNSAVARLGRLPPARGKSSPPAPAPDTAAPAPIPASPPQIRKGAGRPNGRVLSLEAFEGFYPKKYQNGLALAQGKGKRLPTQEQVAKAQPHTMDIKTMKGYLHNLPHLRKQYPFLRDKPERHI